jgi:seryl-tRNA synthetase
MPESHAPDDGAAPDPDLLDRWTEARMLIPTGVDGLYGRGATVERVIGFVTRWVMREGRDEGAEIMRFPPLMPRSHFEASGYFRNFANLVGTVHCFCGDEETHREAVRAHDAGEDWMGWQQPSDLVLVPAACYPVYPALAARGPVPSAGTIVDAASYCFRREPSRDPGRMQMFRQHERIYVGSADGAETFRTRWVERAERLAAALELPHGVELATDPFFGRIGRVMVRSQRAQQLKLELLVPLASDTRHTACVSFNLHLTKMADAFGLRSVEGEPVHTACVGFGLERLALAVLRHHGTDEARWPAALRETSLETSLKTGGREEAPLPP